MHTPISLTSSDRAILIGASGTGKSTLAAHLIHDFRENYPDGRVLVLDTKPRWRADRKPDGTSTRRMYRAFVKGDRIEGSVSLSDPRDWPLAWDEHTNPSHTVVCQRLDSDDRVNMVFQLWAATRFFRTQKASRPALIYFDEGMDFFTVSGSARGSDIVQRCFRAGREKGLTSMIGVQRPKGINLQCLTETSYCALFRINFGEDVKRLHDMGWPRDVPSPSYEEEHVFRLWRAEKGPVAPAYRICPPVRRHATREKG